MAARREGLAAPETVVMRQVTARRAQGACALEEVGSQGLTGVAAGRWRWEAPEGAFPSNRLVAFLSVPL